MLADRSERMQQSRVLCAIDRTERFGEDILRFAVRVVPIDLRLQPARMSRMRRAGQERSPDGGVGTIGLFETFSSAGRAASIRGPPDERTRAQSAPRVTTVWSPIVGGAEAAPSRSDEPVTGTIPPHERIADAAAIRSARNGPSRSGWRSSSDSGERQSPSASAAATRTGQARSTRPLAICPRT